MDLAPGFSYNLGMANYFFCTVLFLGSLRAFASTPAIVGPDGARVELTPAIAAPGSLATLRYTRPNEHEARQVYAHFGFNGWNSVLAGDGAGKAADMDNWDYFVHRAMTWNASAHAYELDVRIPEDGRSLHVVFCWDACANGNEWDNNAGNDYGWPLAFPYIGPVLTWNEKTKPESGVVIQFESQWQESAWIEVRAASSAPSGAYQKYVSDNGPQHRFILTDLRPATEYEYRAGSASGAESPLYRFRTAPSPDKGAAVRFVAFGDAQDHGDGLRFREIAEAIVRDQPDIDFVLSTGDLPWNDKPGHWWTFFDKAKALLASKVFMPVLGNHDTPTVNSNPDHSSFVRYFALPEVREDHAYYPFAIGNARFFGMNSERRKELEPGDVQYRWLEEHLRPDPRWTFVYWHVPPYNTGERHYREQDQMRGITKLFDGVVDWELSGHEHLGQRFRPLRYGGADPIGMNTYGIGPNDGVGYAVLPGSGAVPATALIPAHEQNALRRHLAFPVIGDVSVAAPAFSGYARFDIVLDQLEFRIFSVGIHGSEAVDRIQYQRGEP